MGPPTERLRRHIYGAAGLGLDELIALKRARDLSISVCLPALNEADTVGGICTLLREALMDEAPFVDEIVVIDSDSTDATARRAREAGATVHRASKLVPEVGPDVRGKGDALWRSLSVLSGDIVVWLDSDTRNAHTGFVTDLVAPLLTDESYVLTKAFYERPLQDEEGLLTTGGARLTEIAVRPLLHLFYPELTGMVQPLSGEYAGYRDALVRLPFFTGYAVDIGLLIDISEHHGVDAIAQVDLGRRIHRNRPTLQLGRMSFQVMQAIFKRFEETGRIKLGQDLPEEFAQFGPSPDGPRRETYALGVIERPPLATLP
ncbi:MAG: glucosyl-3-phosphoglycerate synthase [Actinomycetota bacterium]